MATTLTIIIRDVDGARVGEAGELRYFTYTDRNRDLGSWELSVPWDHPARPLLWADGASIEVERVIDDDPDTRTSVFGGPVRKRRRSFTGETGEIAVFYGASWLIKIARRVAHPEPGTSAPPYSLSAFADYTGDLGDEIAQAVTDNLLTLPERGSIGILSGWPAGYPTVAQARWVNLLDFVRGLAARQGWGIYVEGSGFFFGIRVPVDRSADGIEFSLDRGNLVEYDLIEAAPTANYVYVGGSGTGTARTIVEVQDPVAIARWGRAEIFVDKRDTSDPTDLAGAGAAALAENAATATATVTVVDIPTVRWGVHYELGDIVTARFDDVVITDVIEELTVSLTGDGLRIQPTVGAGDLIPGRLTGLARRIRGLASQIDQLNTVQ